MRDSISKNGSQGKKLRPLADYAAAPVHQENWNPFSAKGHLSVLGFIVTLGALVALNHFAGANLEDRVSFAKMTALRDKIIASYAVWAVFCSVSFFAVTNTFIKRWTAIFGIDRLTAVERNGIRLALLSPLLSVYLLALTLLFFRGGRGRASASRSLALILAIVLFIPSHAGWLMWRKHVGELELRPGPRFVLSESSPSLGGSLRRVFQGQAIGDGFLLSEESDVFFIHVFPYLSPVAKYGVSVYGDYLRVSEIAAVTSDEKSPLCAEQSRFMEASVSNCFMRIYTQVASLSPFSSPIIAFYFETKYRQKIMKSLEETVSESQVSRSPDQQVAAALIGLHNLLLLFEPNRVHRDRSVFFQPEGLLRYFGSPEIPALGLAQDYQRYFFMERVLPTVASQLEEVERVLNGSAHLLSEGGRWSVRKELESLNKRVAALRENPFGEERTL